MRGCQIVHLAVLSGGFGPCFGSAPSWQSEAGEGQGTLCQERAACHAARPLWSFVLFWNFVHGWPSTLHAMSWCCSWSNIDPLICFCYREVSAIRLVIIGLRLHHLFINFHVRVDSATSVTGSSGCKPHQSSSCLWHERTYCRLFKLLSSSFDAQAFPDWQCLACNKPQHILQWFATCFWWRNA